MSETDPRVLNIPAGVKFLPALAEALLSGRLVPGFVPNDDPLALADVTIYLPTRRAARELRSPSSSTGSAVAPRSCRPSAPGRGRRGCRHLRR
jgi:inactivated superfamily I helicase